MYAVRDMNKASHYVLMTLMLVLCAMTWSVRCQTSDSRQKLVGSFGWSTVRTADPRDKNKTAQPATSSRAIVTDDDAIRVDTDVVVNDVLVFDKKGRPVEGLTSDAFAIYENGSSQDIALFSHDDTTLPRFVILVIDHSISQLAYLEKSIDAAEILVNKLNANDQMAIITDDIEQIAAPTSDKRSLTESLESLRSATRSGKTGQSKQYGALLAVLNELPNMDGLRPVVIFQTDGDQLPSLRPGRIYQGNNAVGLERFSFDDILHLAELKSVTAYTVFSGISLRNISEKEKLSRTRDALEQELHRFQLLKGISPNDKSFKPTSKFLADNVAARLRDELAVGRIAEMTGGISQTLESADQASEIYERILSDMNHRYVICYYPTNLSDPNKPRKIKIEVRGHPDYKIQGLKSTNSPEK